MLGLMNDEPTTQPVNEDDNEPATQGFVRQELKEFEGRISHKFEEVEDRIDKKFEEVINHFDTVAENIHLDVAGANKDEVDLLTNQVPDHEERIVDLENKAGLPAGPRFQHVK